MGENAPTLDLEILPYQSSQPKPSTLDLSVLPDQPEPLKPPTLDLSVLPDVPEQLKPRGKQQNWGLPQATIGVPGPDPSEEYFKNLRDNATSDEQLLAGYIGQPVLDAMKRLYSPDTTSPRALAAAQNAIAISQVTGMSPVLVLDNADAVNHALFGTGQAREKFLMNSLALIPMTVAGAGMPAAATAAMNLPEGSLAAGWLRRAVLGLAGFEAEENANALIRSYVDGKPFSQTKPYSLQDITPPQASEGMKTLLGLADMFAKFKMIQVGSDKGLQGLGNIWNTMAYQKMSEIVPSQKLYIPGEQIAKFYTGAEVSSGQYYDILQNFGLDNGTVRNAIKYGLDVEVPLSRVVRSMDRPWWGAIKSVLRMSPYMERTEFASGKPTTGLHISGQLEAPEGAPEPGVEPSAPAPSPEGGAAPPAKPDKLSDEQLNIANQILTFFQSHGYSREQAMDAVTNAMRESSLNPTVEGDGGASFWLGQWNGERRKALEALAASKGEAVPSVQTQLEFMDRELNGSEKAAGDIFRGTKSEQEAADALMVHYERPQNPTGHTRLIGPAIAQLTGEPFHNFGTPQGGLSRQAFADAVNNNSSIPQEQKDAFLALTDARAKAWAETEGRSPDDWYGTYIAGLGKGEESEGALAQRTSIKPWPEDFPNATIHTTLGKLTEHPDYSDAKAGDAEAAQMVVDDLIKPEKVVELGKRYPDAMILPVLAKEATGRNKIPRAYAQTISDLTGLPVEENIGQSNVSAHTEKGAFERLLSRANFTGKVKPGQEYIIVDDAITQGGTVSELRHYIENNGGKIVAVTGLTASKGSTVIGIRPETVKAIEGKFGREQTEELLKDYDIAGKLEALTESEGKHLLWYANLDNLRVRINDAGYERGRSAAQRTLPPSAAEQQTRLEQTRKGATQFLEDGKAILHLFETADVSTLIHELGHILRRQLAPEDLATAEKWANIEGGNWDRKAEDKFARAFEAYVTEGVAPSQNLRSVFAKLKAWMLEIYKSIRNLGVRINDDLRDLFDQLLAREEERKANMLYQMNGERERGKKNHTYAVFPPEQAKWQSDGGIFNPGDVDILHEPEGSDVEDSEKVGRQLEKHGQIKAFAGANIPPGRGGNRSENRTYVVQGRVRSGDRSSGRALRHVPDRYLITIGKAFSEIEKRPVEIIGWPVSCTADLVELAQGWRNPNYEELRYVYLKHGVIVDHEGITCRHPLSTDAFIGDPMEGVEHIKERIVALGADSVLMVHNHPSGDPTPSEADRTLTCFLMDRVPELREHIVINSGWFGVVTLSGPPLIYRLPNISNNWTDPILTPSVPHEILGTRLDSSGKIAGWAKALTAERNRPVIIYLSITMTVRGLQEINPGTIRNWKQLADIIPRKLVDFGSAYAALVLPEGSRHHAPKIGESLVRRGVFIDVVSADKDGPYSLRQEIPMSMPSPYEILGGRPKSDSPAEYIR